MKRYITLPLLVFVLSLPFVSAAVPGYANQQAVQLKPVMIIRFNQPQVTFQKQLSMVVSRAKNIKPDVVFDLIQYVPDTTSRSRLAQYEYNKNQVVASLQANGVSADHMRFMQSITPDVVTDEIYIFVR